MIVVEAFLITCAGMSAVAVFRIILDGSGRGRR